MDSTRILQGFRCTSFPITTVQCSVQKYNRREWNNLCRIWVSIFHCSSASHHVQPYFRPHFLLGHLSQLRQRSQQGVSTGRDTVNNYISIGTEIINYYLKEYLHFHHIRLPRNEWSTDKDLPRKTDEFDQTIFIATIHLIRYLAAYQPSLSFVSARYNCVLFEEKGKFQNRIINYSPLPGAP